ncbi:unnamed protein product, partial [Closterium sp. NIES-53]
MFHQARGQPHSELSQWLQPFPISSQFASLAAAAAGAGAAGAAGAAGSGAGAGGAAGVARAGGVGAGGTLTRQPLTGSPTQ